MKIAIIVRMKTRGGTQRQALALAQQLKSFGHNITVYTFAYSQETIFQDLANGLRFVSLQEKNPDWDKSEKSKFLGFLLMPNFFSTWKRRNEYAKALAELIDPETEILNPHGFTTYAVSYYFRKRVRPVPSVYMLNTMPLRSWEAWRKKQLNSGFRISPLRALIYRYMDMLEIRKFLHFQTIVVLDEMNKQFVESYMKLPAVVVRSGVDAEKFAFKQHQLPTRGEVRILMAGILFPHRRVEDVFKAMAVLKPEGYRVHLDVVGNYQSHLEYYQSLLKVAEALSIQNQVSFHGAVSDADLIHYYQNAHIGLFPNWPQTWGLAIFEMLACGTPVILSRGAGAHEVLHDESDCLMVDPRSPQQIALAIKKLVDNKNLYGKLSQQGRKFVENNISWRSYANAMLAVFSKARSNPIGETAIS